MSLSQRVALAAALACLATSGAMAEGAKPDAGQWTEVASGGPVKRYVATTPIIHQDDYAIIWRMQDYASDNFINAKRFRSIKYQVEYNCVSHEKRGLYYEIYSGHMGTGELVDLSYDRDHWRSIPVDGSVGFRVACGGNDHSDQVAAAP